MFEYEGTKTKLDGCTHLALCVLRVMYENGFAGDYPQEVAEIMTKIIELDRKYLRGTPPKPPIVKDEITELNEENNRLFKENEKLKNKLWEIEHIARGEVK